MDKITVILKASKFDNPAMTEVVSRHVMSGENFRVIEYPADKYYFEHSERFDPVLPSQIPHVITAMSIDDNNPVMEATFASKPGVFILDQSEHSTVTLDFNRRVIIVEHERIFGDHRIQLNFHYKREQVT